MPGPENVMPDLIGHPCGHHHREMACDSAVVCNAAGTFGKKSNPARSSIESMLVRPLE